MMKVLLAVTFLFLFRLAYTASQCYQCTYNENEQNIDCVNAETNLQNCTTENEENHDMKQTTDWTCLQRFNYTKTKMLAVVRECIPRLDLNSCTSTGNFTHTYLECVCTINGCNNFVVTLEDETTISPTTTESTRNTTVEATTTLDSGSGTLGLSSASIKCYLLAFSVGFAFLAF